MLDIAVVDDEERIRMGLAKLITDAGDSYRVVGTFGSGQELLSQMSGLQPDLIITDIKMPQMSGLELMARAREITGDAMFAVLSGYDDFEYARTALRQGAMEYLLKPVNISELHRLLENAYALVTEKRNERRLESDDLASFLLGQEEKRLPAHLFEEVCGRLDQQALFRGCYAVFVLQAPPNMTAEALHGCTADWGDERRIIGCVDGRQAAILPLGPSDPAGEAAERASLLLRRQPAGMIAKAGISGVFSGSRWLPRAYEEAMSSLETAWYSREMRICGALGGGHETRGRRELSYRLVRSLEKQIFPALFSGEYARLPKLVSAWLEEQTASMPGWAELKEAAAALKELTGEEMERRGLSSQGVEWPSDPGESPDWRTFAASLKAALEWASGQLEQAKSEHRAVETVKTYIQQHFTEEMELQQLADLVYLTPSYLSKLFKTETGETITDFIIAERITHAKKLLKEEHGLKTYMVGERVGYPDPAYFAKVFKKMTGKTPKEYREFVR
ncbi:response regulator [Paenibacillus lemnae]|uniref:Response regulator n=1 Tax=Paenibacillus lemnae TaxID=1330551 RepID=A0A848M8R4_PAELE|nr:response regulator [Paenibacillus lemnae]NMO96601.1 response regulator [Paenibacillus lemnae]